MQIRFRFQALALAFLCGAALAPAPARAAESYMTLGLPFFEPYRRRTPPAAARRGHARRR